MAYQNHPALTTEYTKTTNSDGFVLSGMEHDRFFTFQEADGRWSIRSRPIGIPNARVIGAYPTRDEAMAALKVLVQAIYPHMLEAWT